MSRLWAILVTAAGAALLGLAAGCAGLRGASSKTAFFGVYTDAYAQRLDGLWTKPGVIVLEVFTGSPAETAGIVAGDVILEMNGEPIKEQRDFDREIQRARPGDRMTIRLQRGASTQDREALMLERSGLPKPVQPKEMASVPRRLVVSREGLGDFRTIAGAIYKSRRGDTIELRPGEYGMLHLWRDGITIEAAPGAVVEGVNAAHQPMGVTLRGLRVEPTGGAHPYGILMVQAQNMIIDGGFVSGATTGIHITSSKRIVLEGVTVRANQGAGILIDRSRIIKMGELNIEDNGSGLEASDSELKLVKSLVVRNGRAGRENGGVLLERCEAELEDNTIVDNKAEGGAASVGLKLDQSVKAAVSRNTIVGHADGVWVAGAAQFSGNNLFDNARAFAPEGQKAPAGTLSYDPAFLDRPGGYYERGKSVPKPMADAGAPEPAVVEDEPSEDGAPPPRKARRKLKLFKKAS